MNEKMNENQSQPEKGWRVVGVKLRVSLGGTREDLTEPGPPDQYKGPNDKALG